MAAVPIQPELVQLFEQLTAASNESPAARALLVRPSPAGAMKPVLTLDAQHPSSGDEERDADQFERVVRQLLVEGKEQEEINRSGFVLFRLDSRAAAGSWEWICLHYQPDGAKVSRGFPNQKTEWQDGS